MPVLGEQMQLEYSHFNKLRESLGVSNAGIIIAPPYPMHSKLPRVLRHHPSPGVSSS
jgi:hypothetical protein